MNASSNLGIGALLVVLLAPAGGASHGADPFEEQGYCPGWVQYFPDDAETRSHPVYYMFDDASPHYVFWVMHLYVESNGITGLQRYDNYCTNATNLGPGTENHAYRDTHDLVLLL